MFCFRRGVRHVSDVPNENVIDTNLDLDMYVTEVSHEPANRGAIDQTRYANLVA